MFHRNTCTNEWSMVSLVPKRTSLAKQLAIKKCSNKQRSFFLLLRFFSVVVSLICLWEVDLSGINNWNANTRHMQLASWTLMSWDIETLECQSLNLKIRKPVLWGTIYPNLCNKKHSQTPSTANVQGKDPYFDGKTICRIMVSGVSPAEFCLKWSVGSHDERADVGCRLSQSISGLDVPSLQ